MSGDKKIMPGIRKGDISLFETLFRSYYSSLVRYAKQIVRDHDTAEEIVQEFFFRFWKDRNKIFITSSLDGYLYRSVHNMCLHYLDHLRVVEKHRKEMEIKGIGEPLSPEEELQHKELQDRITKTLEKLPERCSRIFYMNRFEGLRYSDIAKKLSISVKTVEASMGRALKEFRRALAEPG